MTRLVIFISYFCRFVYCFIFHRSKVYDLLFEAVQSLGGLYVKLIQFTCLRTNLFPENERARFLSFYDRVPTEHIRINAFIEKELGSVKSKRLVLENEEPFAAGSFAQVYMARLDGSKRVIVKVKRPGLRYKLWFDLTIITLIGRIFDLCFHQTIVDVGKLLAEFRKTTFQELDYGQEVKNALYFKRQYINHLKVFIPQTFEELSTNKMIVQEYVPGPSIADLIRLKNSGSIYLDRYLTENKINLRQVMADLVRELLIQGLKWPFFFADPHPGNILILHEGRLAFIDFGNSGKTPRDKSGYFNIFKEITQRSENLNTRKLGEEFLKVGANRLCRSLTVFDEYFGSKETRLLRMMVRGYCQELDKNLEAFRQIENEQGENFTEMIINIFKIGGRFGMQIPTELFSIARSTFIFKSYHEILTPNHHPMREIIASIVGEANPGEFMKQDVSDKSLPIDEAVERVLETLGRLAENNFPLFRKINKNIRMTYA